MTVVHGDPIASAMALLGGRWTLALVFVLMEEPMSFNGLKSALMGISSNVLSQRLRRLTAEGLVEQVTVAGRAAYALTEQGRDLAEVRSSILAWLASRPAGSAE